MKPKALFLGNNEANLKTLLNCDLDILAVIYEKGRHIAYTGEVNEILRERNINLIGIEKGNKKEFKEAINQFHNIDLIVMSFFGIIIPESIINLPKKAFINIHPSYLPYYKGPYPVHWALINGEKQIGVTIHEINEKLDSGPIYAQSMIDISDEDTVETLFKRLDNEVDRLLPDVIEGVLKGTLKPKDQDNEGSYFSNLTESIRFINFKTMTARDIFNISRTQITYGGMLTTYKLKKIQLTQTKLIEEESNNEYPGMIDCININGDQARLRVQCLQGTLEFVCDLSFVEKMTIHTRLGS